MIVKCALVSFQKEMTDMELETGRKVTVVAKWKKHGRIVLYSWVENRIYKKWTWIFSDEVAKQSVEGAAWFLLAVCSKNKS